MPLRCMIVDDNASFRDEARRLLQEQGIDIVGTAASTDQAVRSIGELRPDVVLIDIDLGGESGLELVRRLRDGAGGAVPRMILISSHDEREYDELIRASPAAGFLAKTDLSAVAIHQVLGRPNPSDERRGT